MKGPLARDLLLSTGATHGNGRRPSRRDLAFEPDPSELALWNYRNAVARLAYRDRLAWCEVHDAREAALDALMDAWGLS